MKIILLPAVLLLAVMRLPAQIDLQLDLVSDAFGAVVDISHAGDDRLFIVEQVGRIQLLQADGNVNQTPFLDIINKVGSGGERGLLGLTFHPMYAENGYFFVNYTDKDGNTVVSRYKVSAGDPDLADPASETVLLTLDQPEGNHNGGELNFGPDGYLYIATGDGGGAGDTRDYAQNTTVPFGKLLRIDIDNGTGTGPDYSFGSGYTIPASNPLVDGTGGTLDEIWAVGLRNPWRFSFDRLTGDLWIGDVGQADWEEIDLEPAGSTGGNNYGWRCYEGNESYNSTGCSPASAYTFPVYEYGHDVGCSINGGYVYRGTDYPLLYGLYLYSDYCSGRIWSLESVDGSWVNEELLQVTGAGFVTMGEDYQGELYLGSQDGAVYRLMDATCINDLPDLLLDESPIPTDTYFAGDLLTASATIEAETSVIFLAAGVISLQPGFRAQAGSSLQARNESCATNANTIGTLPERGKLPPLPRDLDLKLFPNPFRSQTTIQYTLPEAADVDVRFVDIYGKVVAWPVQMRRQEAGVYELPFYDSDLSSGIYLVVIRAGAIQEIGRVEIIR